MALTPSKKVSSEKEGKRKKDAWIISWYVGFLRYRVYSETELFKMLAAS